jgi:hypothetical protein
MPGDIKYKDINDDGVINEFDVSVIGNDKPKQYFGIDLGFEYKGFEVSAFFQGTYNRDIDLVNAGNEYLLGFQRGSLNGYSQAYEHSMMRWTPETAATATFPRLSTKVYNAYTGWSYNTRPIQTADLTAPSSSFWIRSGDFIRLKNLSVSYTLPDSFSRNCLGGVKVKIFVTGQNIWTMAACDLVDPEIMDFRNYPLLKGFNTGINIKF